MEENGLRTGVLLHFLLLRITCVGLLHLLLLRNVRLVLVGIRVCVYIYEYK
jgi:hypothetical protein